MLAKPRDRTDTSIDILRDMEDREGCRNIHLTTLELIFKLSANY